MVYTADRRAGSQRAIRDGTEELEAQWGGEPGSSRADFPIPTDRLDGGAFVLAPEVQGSAARRSCAAPCTVSGCAPH